MPVTRLAQGSRSLLQLCPVLSKPEGGAHPSSVHRSLGGSQRPRSDTLIVLLCDLGTAAGHGKCGAWVQGEALQSCTPDLGHPSLTALGGRVRGGASLGQAGSPTGYVKERRRGELGESGASLKSQWRNPRGGMWQGAA